MTTPAPTTHRALNGCFGGFLILLASAAVSILILVWAIKKVLEMYP